MRKLTFVLALLLILLPVSGAFAEGILPVLQTPPPEITEAISYHRAMNRDSTPSASSTGDDRYYYEYSSVTYLNYLDFGRALAQEGFALSQFTQLDDGTGAVDVSVTKDTATLEIELGDIDTPVTLPDGIELMEDVTGKRGYSNYALAMHLAFPAADDGQQEGSE